jgi:hypothetical protein
MCAYRIAKPNAQIAVVDNKSQSMTELPNPFDAIPSDKKQRTTINIPLDITAELKRVEPKTGVLQATAGILFTKLYEQLRTLNLDTGDRLAYHVAVGGLTVTLGSIAGQRSTAAVPPTGRVGTVPRQTVTRTLRRRIPSLGK